MNVQQALAKFAEHSGLTRKDQKGSSETQSVGEMKPSRSKETNERRDSAPPSPVARLGKIAQEFDVRDITPRELSELVRRIHSEGLLGNDEVREFAGVRIDLDQNGQAPDEATNVVAFYEERIEAATERPIRAEEEEGEDAEQEQAEPRHDPETLRQWARRWALMSKMATLGEAGPRQGVNTLA